MEARIELWNVSEATAEAIREKLTDAGIREDAIVRRR